MIKNKKKKRLVSGFFFSVKNIKFENIGVGYLCKKIKNKKERKVTEPPLNPCCKKKNFFFVLKLLPKYSFIANITTFLLRCTVYVLLRKLGRNWRRLVGKKLFFLLRHLNEI